jgi:hypothetical protein
VHFPVVGEVAAVVAMAVHDPERDRPPVHPEPFCPRHALHPARGHPRPRADRVEEEVEVDPLRSHALRLPGATRTRRPARARRARPGSGRRPAAPGGRQGRDVDRPGSRPRSRSAPRAGGTPPDRAHRKLINNSAKQAQQINR